MAAAAFTRLFDVRDDAASGRGRDAGFLHDAFGRGLIAHRGDHFRTRTDERQAVVGADLREARVLGKKTVTRMHRVAAGDQGGRNDVRDVQIRACDRARPDAESFVGTNDVFGLAIRLRKDGHGRDPKLAARALDPDRNLAAVGDEHLAKDDAILDRAETAAGRIRPANRRRPRSTRFGRRPGCVPDYEFPALRYARVRDPTRAFRRLRAPGARDGKFPPDRRGSYPYARVPQRAATGAASYECRGPSSTNSSPRSILNERTSEAAKKSASRRIRSAACASRDIVDRLPPAVGETLGHAGPSTGTTLASCSGRQRVARAGEGRIDFGQRDQHERAFVHVLVRKPDRTVEPHIVVCENVQVDRPRSPAIPANAPQTPLDRL